MRFTEDELFTIIKVTMAMNREVKSELERRKLQSKVDKQSSELKRLYAEVTRLKQLAHSRGQFIVDIQRRAMERQLGG